MNKIYKVSELAEMIGATINGNPDHEISGVNSLKLANANEITFLSNVKYRSQLEKSKAAVILVAEDWKFPPQEGQTLLYCKNIDKSFSKLCKLFAPEPQKFEPGIHPSAVVHPTAQIAEGVYIGPTAVVEANAVIGKNTVIGACVYVGENVEIGENCMIYPNVSIMRRCKLGNKIIIHGGATIGGDGFGFNATFTGLVKVPQDGIVVTIEPTLLHVAEAPCARHGEGAVYGVTAQGCVAPGVGGEVSDPAGAIVGDAGGAFTGLHQGLDQIKEGLYQLGEVADLGEPVVHLKIYVRMEI